MHLMGFKGWTSLWNVCYYYPGWEHHTWLVRHEEKHLEQMKRDGKIKYMVRYMWQWATVGYQNIDYEIEARQAEGNRLV
jgi:spermidine/putrescine-binding protein